MECSGDGLEEGQHKCTVTTVNTPRPSQPTVPNTPEQSAAAKARWSKIKNVNAATSAFAAAANQQPGVVEGEIGDES